MHVQWNFTVMATYMHVYMHGHVHACSTCADGTLVTVIMYEDGCIIQVQVQVRMGNFSTKLELEPSGCDTMS